METKTLSATNKTRYIHNFGDHNQDQRNTIQAWPIQSIYINKLNFTNYFSIQKPLRIFFKFKIIRCNGCVGCVFVSFGKFDCRITCDTDSLTHTHTHSHPDNRTHKHTHTCIHNIGFQSFRLPNDCEKRCRSSSSMLRIKLNKSHAIKLLSYLMCTKTMATDGHITENSNGEKCLSVRSTNNLPNA